MKPKFRRFFSTDNPKAEKATNYGYLNGINYMSPHKSGGTGNLCPHASAGCIALCLGEHAGQAAISETVRESRKRKAEYFMRERKTFMAETFHHIEKLIQTADKANLKPVIRLNGSTDIAFEGISVEIDGSTYRNLMEAFPAVQFVDYTKNPLRFNRTLPPNLHLTFSLSETNETIARDILQRGFNVAAVFANGLPETYLGRSVINGDLHDLRFLDSQGGFIVGLSPKGNKAKRDQSGFVIREYSNHNA